METIMRQNNTGYSYLVKITIAGHHISMIVRNQREVPNEIIETMAKQRIEKEINSMYTTFKHYRTQTHEQFNAKMIKQSNFEIEDLNVVEIYDLGMKFENGTIVNEIKNESQTEKRESSINKISEEIA